MALRLISVLIIAVSIGGSLSRTTTWGTAQPSSRSGSEDAKTSPCLSPEHSDVMLSLHTLNEFSAGCVNASCGRTAVYLTEDELNKEFALFVGSLSTDNSDGTTAEPVRGTEVTVTSTADSDDNRDLVTSRGLTDVMSSTSSSSSSSSYSSATSEEGGRTIPYHSSTDMYGPDLTTTDATHPDARTTNDVTTHGTTLAPPSDEGEEDASTAEIFDIAGGWNGDGANELQQRSLCPWKYVANIDRNRKPIILAEAECLYEQCGHELRINSGVGCEKVYTNIPVLRRVQSDKCPGKTEWRFERSFHRLAVACTCSVEYSV